MSYCYNRKCYFKGYYHKRLCRRRYTQGPIATYSNMFSKNNNGLHIWHRKRKSRYAITTNMNVAFLDDHVLEFTRRKPDIKNKRLRDIQYLATLNGISFFIVRGSVRYNDPENTDNYYICKSTDGLHIETLFWIPEFNSGYFTTQSDIPIGAMRFYSNERNKIGCFLVTQNRNDIDLYRNSDNYKIVCYEFDENSISKSNVIICNSVIQNHYPFILYRVYKGQSQEFSSELAESSTYWYYYGSTTGYFYFDIILYNANTKHHIDIAERFYDNLFVYVRSKYAAEPQNYNYNPDEYISYRSIPFNTKNNFNNGNMGSNGLDIILVGTCPNGNFLLSINVSKIWSDIYNSNHGWYYDFHNTGYDVYRICNSEIYPVEKDSDGTVIQKRSYYVINYGTDDLYKSQMILNHKIVSSPYSCIYTSDAYLHFIYIYSHNSIKKSSIVLTTDGYTLRDEYNVDDHLRLLITSMDKDHISGYNNYRTPANNVISVPVYKNGRYFNRIGCIYLLYASGGSSWDASYGLGLIENILDVCESPSGGTLYIPITYFRPIYDNTDPETVRLRIVFNSDEHPGKDPNNDKDQDDVWYEIE